MRRYRHRLPVGLPPTLTGRILVPGSRSGPVPYAYEPGLGALGFSFKKLAKSAVKTVGKAAQIVTAPAKLATIGPLKATTWIGKSMGLPVGKVDSLLKGEMKTTIQDTKTAAIIGAGVALGIATGGTGTMALIATLGPAAGQLLSASQPKNNIPKAVQPPTPVVPDMASQVAEYSTDATYSPQGQGQSPLKTTVDSAQNLISNALAPQQPGQKPTVSTMPAHGAPGAPQAGGINPVVIVGGVAALGVLAVLLLPRKRATP